MVDTAHFGSIEGLVVISQGQGTARVDRGLLRAYGCTSYLCQKSGCHGINCRRQNDSSDSKTDDVRINSD